MSLQSRGRVSAFTVSHVTPAVSVSESAAAKVRQLIDAEGNPDLFLRVAVRPGGCSGFSYEMFFDTDLEADDQVVELHGVRVAVDPDSAGKLMGSTLDYKDALQGGGFAINNPNAQRSCGCGQSFS